MYKKIIDKIVWSFSSLRLYEECPYAFYLHKIEKREGEDNFYAANGSAMHEALAAFFSSEITFDELPSRYIELYNEITDTTYYSVMENTFESCLDYLCSIDSLFDGFKVLNVEEKLNFKIGKYNFVGYADLVLQDKKTGEIWLVDHKSSNHFLKKDGTPLKSQAENFYSYRHQMYLYCEGLRDVFGYNVDKICWHHFKDNGKLTVIPYKEEELNETLEWATGIIEKVKKDRKFECAKESYVRCHTLCDFRNSCEYLETED